MDLLLLSASSRVRTPAPLNHRIYADRHGLPYAFDLTPAPVERIFFHKIESVRRFLPHHEWLFWIDDDAFFTRLDDDLTAFLADVGERDLVFCASPVNPQGGWTWMSSGQFFIRRSERMLALLDAVLATDLETVRASWDHERFGLFTNGDQDALVQLLHEPGAPWTDAYVRLPWQAFNSRPYHYERRLDEHFLCHFAVPGGRPKMDEVRDFAERLGTSTALCDPALLAPYRTFIERSDLGALLGPGAGSGTGGGGETRAPSRARPSILRRIARRARRLVRG